jgi:hypothetical protein
MKYLEWNNLIGAHLFDEQMAGKEVYLFLTKQDIIHVGKMSGNFNESGNETIWNDFLHAIRTGLPGEPRNSDYQGKLEYAFQKVKILTIDGIKVLFPPYLGYLALTVLPILEVGQSQASNTFRANNYYSHIRDFLKLNKLPELPNLSQARNWNQIWQHLSDWTIQTKKTDLGVFQIRNFSPSWVYVGLPLSQCLINRKALQRLPEVFLKEGLTPDCFISDKEWRALLERIWVKDLEQRPHVLQHILQEGDEMGKVLLEIIRQSYMNWQGEAQVEEEVLAVPSILLPVKRVRKAGIRARLFLSFKIEKSTGDLKWGCRMYSKNDYPEDLAFNTTPCHELRENWSNQLELGFQESARLKDIANKWEAVLPEKNLRLFIGGATLNLSSEYWVEADQINRISPMHLLCKNDLKPFIENWQNHFQSPGYCKELTSHDLGCIPEGWSLFKFQYPKETIEGEPAMQLPTTKKILLVGGVQTGNRIYQKSCLPELVLENGDDTETAFIELIQGGRKIPLQKQTNAVNRWHLPKELKEGDEFRIYAGEEKTYPVRIAVESLEALHLDNSLCPKRNRLGMVDETLTDTYVQGSLVNGFDFKRQLVYEHDFQPVQKNWVFEPSDTCFTIENDLLLEYLTRKKIIRSREFFEAYENVLSRIIAVELDEAGGNLTSLKRQVLNWYDFLGYVDFDYQSKRAIVNPPQLFLVPTQSGRKAFLTGARTPDFAEKVLKKANELGLNIQVISKAGTCEPWILLPDTIFLEARNLPNYGMSEIKAFTKDLNIYFDPNHIVQWGLLNFSATIEEYAKSLLPDERFEDYDWSRKIFNPNTFRFERLADDNFDKTFSLIEYQFNAYTYHHVIWKNGKAYPVDKGWGRWLVMQHDKKQVVFRDKNGITAIPTGMPLPRLISEAFILCSGRIPEQKYLTINGIHTVFSLYRNVIKIMLDNEFSRIGQEPVHVQQIF